MSNTIKKEPGHLPEEKKQAPLGKWLLSNLLRLNNFPFRNGRNKDVLLTTVSNHKGDPQTLCFGKLSSGQKDERSALLCRSGYAKAQSQQAMPVAIQPGQLKFS